jgi:hypothetical protein
MQSHPTTRRATTARTTSRCDHRRRHTRARSLRSLALTSACASPQVAVDVALHADDEQPELELNDADFLTLRRNRKRSNQGKCQRSNPVQKRNDRPV